MNFMKNTVQTRDDMNPFDFSSKKVGVHCTDILYIIQIDNNAAINII